MTIQTEANANAALKLALVALESSNKLINGTETKFGLEGAMDGYYSGCFDVEGNNKLLNKAINAIKEALAQPEQEPVAWMHPDGRLWTFGRGFDKSTFTIPLYTTTPQEQRSCDMRTGERPWVSLTDEEVDECFSRDPRVAARNAEAKLKEKNT